MVDTVLSNSQTGGAAAPSSARTGSGSRLWTPAAGPSGMILIARPQPLLAVVGGVVLTAARPNESAAAIAIIAGSHADRGRIHPVNLVGLGMGNTRQKEPTRVIGHPDLASGASVQRGETLYVSVAEAVYRESRGEEVEIHLMPTQEDAEALADLRSRARHRWESDRLPDGWTRPLPPPQQPSPKDAHAESAGELPEELRALAERIRSRESRGH